LIHIEFHSFPDFNFSQNQFIMKMSSPIVEHHSRKMEPGVSGQFIDPIPEGPTAVLLKFSFPRSTHLSGFAGKNFQ
jgi:hypothetical protein